jgi:hypothetical protein
MYILYSFHTVYVYIQFLSCTVINYRTCDQHGYYVKNQQEHSICVNLKHRCVKSRYSKQAARKWTDEPEQTKTTKHGTVMCDFRLPLRCKWDLRSSGISHSVEWYRIINLCCVKSQKNADPIGSLNRYLGMVPAKWSLYWRMQDLKCGFIVKMNPLMWKLYGITFCLSDSQLQYRITKQ